MHRPTKIDYEKLLGSDFGEQRTGKRSRFSTTPPLERKMGAKIRFRDREAEEPMLLDPPSEVAPGAPMLRGLGGRKVTSA